MCNSPLHMYHSHREALVVRVPQAHLEDLQSGCHLAKLYRRLQLNLIAISVLPISCVSANATSDNNRSSFILNLEMK